MANRTRDFENDVTIFQKLYKKDKDIFKEIIENLKNTIDKVIRAKTGLERDVNIELYKEISPLKTRLKVVFRRENPADHGNEITYCFDKFKKGQTLKRLPPFLLYLWEKNENEERYAEKFYKSTNTKIIKINKSIKKKSERIPFLDLEDSPEAELTEVADNLPNKKTEAKPAQSSTSPSESGSKSPSSDSNTKSPEEAHATDSLSSEELLKKTSWRYRQAYKEYLFEYLGDKKNPRPFGGRGNEIKKLNEWLNTSNVPNKLLLITEAGLGKSALLANWIQQISNDKWSIVFIPISIRFGSSQAETIFPALALQLAALYNEEYSVPKNDSTDFVAECQAFAKNLINERFPGKGQLILVFDGLDEITGGDLEGSFFLKQASNVKVLVAARLLAGDEGAEGWRNRLKWNTCKIEKMNLPLLGRNEIEDVIKRMLGTEKYQNELKDKSEILKQLVRLTKGYPLLIRFYVEDLWTERNRLPELKFSELKHFEEGYRGYFTQWWRDQEKLWGENSPIQEKQTQDCLIILAYAKGPLLTQEIRTILSHSNHPNPFNVNKDILKFSRFVRGNGNKTGFVLSHPKLNEFFLSGDFLEIDQSEIVGIKKAFLHWGEEILNKFETEELNPKNTDDFRYLLQFYSSHLREAENKIPLKNSMALVSNGWRKAWESYEGGNAGFAKDVRFSWDRASKTVQENKLDLIPNFSDQVKCILCLSSISTLGTNIFPELLGLSLETKVLSPLQVLNLIEQNIKDDKRSEALVSVAPFLNEQHANEAFEIATRFKNKDFKVKSISCLIPYLKKDQLYETQKIAYEVGNEMLKIKVSSYFLKHLEGNKKKERLEEVLKSIHDIHDEKCKVKALTFLISNLEGEEFDKILKLARNINDDYFKFEILSLLAKLLKEEQLNEALKASCEIQDNICKIKALSSLVPRLKGWQLNEALRIIDQIGSDYFQNKVLFEKKKNQTINENSETLKAACNIEDDRVKANSLSSLAKYLEDDQLEEALKAAQKIKNKEYKFKTLSSLIKHLKSDQKKEWVSEVIKSAREIGDENSKQKAISLLTNKIEDEQINEANIITDDIAGEKDKNQMFSLLSKDLENDQRKEEVDKALKKALTIDDEKSIAEVLFSLAPLLNERQQEVALETAMGLTDERFMAEALSALAPHFKRNQIKKVLIAAKTINSNKYKVSVLSSLAAFLDGKEKKDLTTFSLNVVQKIIDEEQQAEALSLITSYLEEDQLEVALNIANEISDERLRTGAISSMAPQFGENQLYRAFDFACEFEDEFSKVEVFTSLAPYLKDKGSKKKIIIANVLSSAYKMVYEKNKAETFSFLAPYLEDDQVDKALDATHKMEDHSFKAETLLSFLETIEKFRFQHDRKLSFTSKEILRCCSKITRDKALNFISELSIFIIPRSSKIETQQITRTIIDVTSWWP